MFFAAWLACTSTDTTGPSAAGLPQPNGFDDTKESDGNVYVTDSFTHHISPVDLLMVIDNSCSMAEEQELLDVNGQPFIDFLTLTGSDYHVGVVTTDMDNPEQAGRLQPTDDGSMWIDPTTYDPFTAFSTLVDQGIEGSGTEMGANAMYTAIEVLGETANAGFYRPDAMFIGVILSDEHDFTYDYSDLTADVFVSWLEGLKPETGLRTFNSIVGPPGGCTYAEDGETYYNITNLIGGVVANICDSTFNGLFDTMAASIPTTPLPLSETPLEGTIQVVATEPGLDPRSLFVDLEWVHLADTNQIDIVGALAEGSLIEVTYWPAPTTP